MSSAALRQLGLGSVKQIYKLDTFELCTALQNAGRRKVTERPLWDALLYRATLLCTELQPLELALTADALAKVKHRDANFEDYLLREVRAKARRFIVRDTALLLNALAKLALRDELLTRSLMPPLIRRIGKKTRLDDLALLALSLVRLGDVHREPICDQVVSAVMPRIGTIDNGQTLSLLACAFTLRPKSGTGAEALFADDTHAAPAEEDDGGGVAEEPEREAPQPVLHAAFVETLLEQCERNMWNFRSGDLLHLALALSALAKNDLAHMFPSRLLRRLGKRMENLYFEFLPGQFVRFLEVVAHIPELESQCAVKLLDEIAYRVRDVTPVSCVSVLLAIRRVGGHAKAHSAVSWRLTREDAAQVLSPAQLCTVAEVLCDLRPWLWESREALLNLLQGLRRRQHEPHPAIVSRLLSAYGEIAVRDTQWFHLSKRLCLRDLSTLQPLQKLPQEAEPLDERFLADTFLALARLNLPRLVDAAELLARAASTVQSPEHVASVLDAAAVFCLIDRRPNDLCKPGCLAPLLAVAPSPPVRLFPFSDTAVAACAEELLDALQASAVRYAVPRVPDEFEQAVGRELGSWPGIGLVSSVVVGPLCVPWAASLVGLAEHLRGNPLEPTAAVAEQDVAKTALFDEPHPEHSADEAPPSEAAPAEPRPRARGRRSRRSPAHEAKGFGLGAEPTEVAPIEADEAVLAEAAADSPMPRTHVLLELLRDGDFYHASASVRAEKQRAKRLVLGAQRFAELSLLRRHGWRVCCIPEHLWNHGVNTEASRSNRALVFGLIADLAGRG